MIALATVDLIYAVGLIVVISSLYWPGANPLRFWLLASIHILFGVFAMWGAFPNLPTLTNNNFLILTHGMLDIYWFAISIICYAMVLFSSIWWGNGNS